MDDNRIISLARECGTYQNGDMIVMSNEGLLYFTKMIARECIAKCSDLDSMQYIAQHFGVKVEGLDQ